MIKIIEDKPTSFADCLQVARVRFQKHFVNDIKQLLHVYPLDKLTKEGRPFWSLPKRAPRPIDFNSENPTHAQLVASFACLLAKMHSIEIPFDKPRSKEARHEMALKASAFPVKDFVPNDQKAS